MTPKQLSKLLKSDPSLTVAIDYDRLIRQKLETIRLLQEQMRENVRRIIKLRGEIREIKESHEGKAVLENQRPRS
ncbi:MAG: hypothetical protein ABIF11_00770, partial [Nitrospirota bacterium]